MKFKSFLTLLMLAIVIIVSAVPVCAAETVMVKDEYTFTTNEYDMLIEIQNTSSEELKARGYSAKDIEEVKSIVIEDELMERAALSIEELESLGYTESQIQLLKGYDGSSLSENPEMRGVFADLNGTLSKVNVTNKSARAQFLWTWSNAPVFDGSVITEVVSCGYAAVNTDSIPYTVKPNYTSCTVSYYNGSTRVDVDNPTVTRVGAWQSLTVEFPMGKVISGENCWAKTGSLNVEVIEQSVVNKLSAAAFLFEYGHPGFVVSDPYITVSITSTGIGFVGEFEIHEDLLPMFNQGIIIERDGSTDYFVGEEVDAL